MVDTIRDTASFRFQFIYCGHLWPVYLTRSFPYINFNEIYTWVFDDLLEYNGFLTEC